MIFFRIAMLSMKKHLRRTIVIVTAVALSVAVMVFIEGMLTGLSDSFFQNLFQDTGHIQVHESGYSERLDPYTIDYRIERPGEVETRLREHPMVTAAESLAPFGALLIRDGKNLPVAAIGIDPQTTFYERVRRGMVEGSLPSEAGGVAVSVETARLLDIDYGGNVVLLVEDTTGSPYYAQLEVVGLFRTDSTEFDTTHLFLTHEQASELLYLQGSTIEIRALVQDPASAPAVAADLAEYLADRSLEAAPWQEIHGSFVVAFELFDIFMLFIDVVLVAVAATVIANAILMNVFERGPEFGTLRAIGMKKRQHAWMILTEGGVEGLIGSVVGVVVGVPVLLYFEAVGLPIGEFGEGFGLGRTVFPALTAVLVVRSFVAGIVIAVASSGYVTFVSARRSIMALLGQS